MQYVVYKQRWVILMGVVACGFMQGYMPAMYAISNDMMSSYFRITPLQVDMLSSADTAMAVVVCLAISVVGNKVGVRLLTLTSATSFGICTVAVGIAITDREFYNFMLFGRLISGISAGVLYILPPILANAWFPSSQVATAASIPVTATCVGAVISPAIYSNLLPKINDTVVTFYNSSARLPNKIVEFGQLQRLVITNMAVFGALSAISIVIFCVFAKNNPPTPPSGGQARLAKHAQDAESNIKELRQNVLTLKNILKSRSFWNVLVIATMGASSVAFSVYLQPSMLRATFVTAPNSVAGYCMIVTTITSSLGSIAAGKILDKWHAYKSTCLLGFLLSGGSCIAVYFSQVYEILSIFITFHAIVGLFRFFIYMSIAELMLEVTYPRNRTVATCLYFAIYNLSTFTWTPLERWVMGRFGEEYVAWVVITSQLVSAGVMLISQPQYKRTDANKNKVEGWEKLQTASKLLSREPIT